MESQAHLKPLFSTQDLPILFKWIKKGLDNPRNLEYLRKADLPRSPRIVHYTQEIFRFWTKIHYLIAKINRSLESMGKKNFIPPELLFYISYRVKWEFATVEVITAELQPFIVAPDYKAQLQAFIKRLRNFNWDIALKEKSLLERISLLSATPTFVIKNLSEVMDLNSIHANLDAMNEMARTGRLFLRINPLSHEYDADKTKEEFFSYLQEKSITYKEDEHYNGVISIGMEHRAKIITSSFYGLGKVIIQDKASMVAVHLLDPKPEELIWDVSAAPGMKSSHIVHMTGDRARLLSSDFHRKRLRAMRNLMSQLVPQSPHLINCDGINPPLRNMESRVFDKIILDAPCTGSGNFMHHPELKWRQNFAFLNQNLRLQADLLRSALNLLKPGGLMLYSTCSLYPEEGEHQILAILDLIIPQELPEWFSKGYLVANQLVPGTGRLFPVTHGTLGFFYALFRKKLS
jgi:16S rRNA (cytosine967-C5)-methyltransferase